MVTAFSPKHVEKLVILFWNDLIINLIYLLTADLRLLPVPYVTLWKLVTNISETDNRRANAYLQIQLFSVWLAI